MATADAPFPIVRQPVFDANRNVVGYHMHADVPATDGPAPLAAVLAEGTLTPLSNGHPAFVPVDETTLLTLPPLRTDTGVVLALPSTITPTPAVREACAEARRRGYRIALSFDEPARDNSALLRYVDFVFADLESLDSVLRPPVTYRPVHPPTVVVRNLNTTDAFEQAVAAGGHQFQGDFISRPRLHATSNLPTNRITALRLLRALQNPDLSIHELEELVKPDAAFCLRVLRAVNGVAYGQQSRITSLRQALSLVGTNTIREWASLWSLSHFSAHAPAELVRMAALRGRFCELLARTALANTGTDAFLLGMCSLLDAILESPMPAVLRHLPLPESIEAALLGQQNVQRELLDCAIALEHGRWEESRRLAVAAGLDGTRLGSAYSDALKWITQFEHLSAAA